MKCLHCSNLDLQRFKEHARVGFGWCKLEPVGVFMGISRDDKCSKWKQADAEVIAKRDEWVRLRSAAREEYRKGQR